MKELLLWVRAEKLMIDIKQKIVCVALIQQVLIM